MNIYKELYRATKGDYPSPRYGAIFHDSGYLVSTNGHILAKIKADYPPGLEGKLMDSSGEEVKDTYMKYQTFLDAIDKMEPVDCPNLLQACKNVVKYKHPEKIHISLRPDFNVRAKFFVDAYKLLGTEDVELFALTGDGLTCLLKSKDSYVLICKIALREAVAWQDVAYTIDEAMLLVSEKKTNKERYE